MLSLHIIFGVLSLGLHGALLTDLRNNRAILVSAYGSIVFTVGTGAALLAEGASPVHIGVALVLYGVAHGSLAYLRHKVTDQKTL